MYNIVLNGVRKKYEYAELIKMFLPESEFKLHALEVRQGEYITQEELDSISSGLDNKLEFSLCSENILNIGSMEDADGPGADNNAEANTSADSEDADGPGADKNTEAKTSPAYNDKTARNRLKAEIFNELSRLTGIRPKWGTLTGVRPVKLAGSIIRDTGSTDSAFAVLKDEYLLDDDKARLILDIYSYQDTHLGDPPPSSAGIYVGIPFCPTRCLYCSFASNPADDRAIAAYVEALLHEIRSTGRIAADRGIVPESVYIGGGTPTVLGARDLERVMDAVRDSFDLSMLREYTVECGRPDTITEEKLDVIVSRGAERISINPQTMKAETLKIIGRDHTPDEIVRAFEMALRAGIPVINCDVIAGLPGEDADDFRDTLDAVIDLGAQNITTHTLAVKRASRLIDIDSEYHRKQAETVSEMLETGSSLLAGQGYIPYYLYRQKHMAGNLENTGYCRDDTFSVYNIRIMEERQHIIAMGAGAISKVYYPEEDRLERVANVTNQEIYVQRIDEMIQRKEKGF